MRAGADSSGQDGARDGPGIRGPPDPPVGQWKKDLPEQAADIFDAKRGPKPAYPSASPERLYSESGRLKMEWTNLKKSGLCLSPRGQAGAASSL